MSKRLFVLMTTVVTCLAVASPASAQGGVGLRAGASGGPGQFVFGVHFDTPEVVPNLTFRPNVDVGIGDNRTIVGMNVEFAYWLPLTDTDWKLYFPVGPALVVTSRDDNRGQGGGTDVGGGFGLGVGVQHARGFFVELKVAFVDSQDVRFSVGYVF